jgi:hypothetical protein
MQHPPAKATNGRQFVQTRDADTRHVVMDAMGVGGSHGVSIQTNSKVIMVVF